MLLPAHFEGALQAVRRLRKARGRVAPAHEHRRQHIAFGLQRRLHRKYGGQGRDVELHGARRTAGLHDRIGHHEAHHLAHVLHGVHCEHWFVVRKGGQQLVARHVGRQHHAAHAAQCQRGTRIHAVQAAMGHRREDGRCIQRALHLGQVIDVMGGARHLGACAFVDV